MIKNVQIVSQHSQVKELANDLKFEMLGQLIGSAATCQQLATVLGVSKQKIHYNLNKLLAEGLIVITDDTADNGKEVYYRAKAKNYVLDFALGKHISDGTINGRGVIQSILESEYKLPLSVIAARILKESLKLKSRQKLVIVTGKFNFPLVEKILSEAGRLGIRCTLIYQDEEMIRSKYEDYSLAAFNADYENFNRLLRSNDAYLNLNGEARYIPLKDPDKLNLRQSHFFKSSQIIKQKKIRVAMMPGLLNDTLSEKAIESELQFWKALDINYDSLAKDTIQICKDFSETEHIQITGNGSQLKFMVSRVLAETGSFTKSEYQSPMINLPGGEILIVPQSFSMNGEIRGDVAYAFGEKILKPVLQIKNNEIKKYDAESNSKLLGKAILGGGLDGRKIALICMGTNPNITLGDIDNSFKQKTRGLLSVYWGDNRALGGDVAGTLEWFIQIEQPNIQLTKKEV
ncbi:MAG: aminopeptidase [Candidatus Cloacimonadaceae bacterium]|jgi:leucyl aminopeptidase (aminopeptidase T)|nr:aminopeptidase [Candidatus Cloacimonadaceae bacterium]